MENKHEERLLMQASTRSCCSYTRKEKRAEARAGSWRRERPWLVLACMDVPRARELATGSLHEACNLVEEETGQHALGLLLMLGFTWWASLMVKKGLQKKESWA